MTEMSFQTYEERFPFESKYLEGEEPFFQIERLSPSQPDLVAVNCDSAGFEMFAEEGQAYEVRAVGIQLSGPDAEIALSRTASPNSLKRLYLYTSVPDVRVSGSLTLPDLAKFESISEIHLSQVPSISDLRPILPNVRSATIDSMSLAIEGVAQFWTELEYLRIDDFEGSIKEFGPLHMLSTLKLYRAKLKSLDAISTLLPELESLTVQGQRAPLDVSALSDCKKLRYLRFDSFSKAEGLDNLTIPTLDGAYLSHLQSSQFIDVHENLSWLRVKRYSGEVSQTMLDNGWAKSHGEFGFGNSEVPKPLRG